MICIPYHEPCIKGRESIDICGYCRQNAEQRADPKNPLPRGRKRLVGCDINSSTQASQSTITDSGINNAIGTSS